MAEHGDIGAALRRLEAALNRIAVQVAKPRPHPPSHEPTEASESPDAPAPVRHEIATKIDDLIGGLRSALNIERSP
jgi:hypothetical protein